MDYIYDGTFLGLLTCIYHHYYEEKASGIFTRGSYQQNLMNSYIDVETDEDKASRVYQAIEHKISAYDLRRVYKVYLSCDKDKEMKILRYVVLGFRIGSGISMLHSNTIVMDVEKIEKKINVEKERMLQFVRFSLMDNNVLYGPIEPDNDVVELLSDHFCRRFKNEPFIIHDVRRDKALIAYQGSWYITYFTKENVPSPSSEEYEYRRLWKNYFDNIAIKERKNSRCQDNNMPRRYRKHLTECSL